MNRLLLVLICAVAFATPVKGASLCMIAWNLESGESEKYTLTDTVTANPGCHLWALSEAPGPDTVSLLAQAAQVATGNRYDWVLSSTSWTGPDGTPDLLALVYQTKTLELLRTEELHTLKFGRGRAPYVAEFRFKPKDQNFLVMLNHLHSSSDEKNQKQAKAINAWGATQSLPIVTLGDFNFFYDIDEANPNAPPLSVRPGLKDIQANGVWNWVKPASIIPTHCSMKFSSVLDFIFVGNDAANWNGVSVILGSPNFDCQDSVRGSDHFPVRADFVIQ